MACQKLLEATVLGTHDCSKQTLLESEQSRVFRSRGVQKIIDRRESKIMVLLSLECRAKKYGGGEDRVLLGEAST